MNTRKKVLVCDDDVPILLTLSFIVRQEGYELITAEDGEEGLRLARTELPDLILLDVTMPKKCGFDVCREIKAGKATEKPYVIMLTARGRDADVEEGYRSGADDVMKKPYSPKDLCRRLHELLDT